MERLLLLSCAVCAATGGIAFAAEHMPRKGSVAAPWHFLVLMFGSCAGLLVEIARLWHRL